LHLLIEFKIV